MSINKCQRCIAGIFGFEFAFHDAENKEIENEETFDPDFPYCPRCGHENKDK